MVEASQAIKRPFSNGVRAISGCMSSVDTSSEDNMQLRSSRGPGQDSSRYGCPTEHVSSIQWPESVTNAPPDRLRWIADYLDVADRAITVLACVQGIEYSSASHRAAEQDLRRWARWLEVRPALSAGFAMARLVPGSEDTLVRCHTSDS